MIGNWPHKWGFEGDPRKWVGRRIESVEVLGMDYGSVSDTCLLFQFDDGSRGWCIGRPSNGIAVGPSRESIESSRIVRPEEVGQVAEHLNRKKRERELAEIRRKRSELDRLRKELGE